MSLSQLNITSAYLHGELDNEVYIQAPGFLKEILMRIENKTSDRNLRIKARTMLSEFQQGRQICLLKKALYDLREFGRKWHFKLSTTLKDADLIPTNVDSCVYMNWKWTIFLLIYVDDILIILKNCKDQEDIIDMLKRQFAIKDLGETKFCLDIEITRDDKNIYLSGRLHQGFIIQIRDDDFQGSIYSTNSWIQILRSKSRW